MPLARVIPFLSALDRSHQATGEDDLIVQVGRDKELCRLRGRVISSAGFQVRSVSPEELARELQSPRDARVWLFCHTLEFYEHEVLAAAVRRSRPSAKLLRLKGIHPVGSMTELFDQSLEASESVDTLLWVVSCLARREA